MENAINSIVENFESVNELDADYCKRCLTADYANFAQLSPDFDSELYNNEELQKILVEAAQEVRSYCTVHPDTSTFFESLRNSGIDISKLTTFLWYCIDFALQPDNREKRAVGIALAASDLYLVLASIKSAKVYKLYDINIFQKCIEVLKYTEKLLRPLASKVATILHPKRRGAAAAADQERNDPLSIGNETEQFVVLVKNAMRSLFVVFHSHSIADAVLENDERCPAIIDFLRDVAYLDIEHATNHQRRPLDSVDNINHASDLSFAIVQEVLSKSSELRALTIASRFVMPYLLFWVCGSTKLTIAGTLPAVLRDARTVTVRFLSSRVDSLTRIEMDCYMKVLKSLPLKCFDRAEYRVNVAETFVDILTFMPQLAYFLFDDIYVLGCHTKTSNRSFAYEIVNFLLRKFPFDALPDPPISYEALVMDENVALNMDAIEDAEELQDVEMVNEADVEEATEDSNGDISMVNRTNENEEETEQNEQSQNEGPAEVPGPPPFRINAERSPDDLEFVRQGMTPKQAMLMLIINGLIDKNAKQKALQTVESLFKNESCIKDLCKLATKFINENSEELNLIGRVLMVKEEPMDEEMPENNVDMEVEASQPVVYCDDLLYLTLKGFENDKVAICKQALSTCTNVLLGAHVFDPKLFERCVEEIRLKTWDTAIHVRKQAAVCLKELLLDEDIGRLPFVENAWLSGLLHQVQDNEEGVKQQATKFVTEYIVNGLLKPRPNTTWELMERVENNAEYTRYLAICFTEHTNNASGAAAPRTGNIQSLIQQLVRLLVRLARENNCPAAGWMLLAELSHRLTFDPECAKNAWDSLELDRSDDRIPTYIAKILANRCSSLDASSRNNLKAKIAQQIKNNVIAVSHISAVCYAFACLSNGVLPNGGKGNKAGIKEISNFVQSYNNQVSTLLNDSLFLQIRRDIASRAATCTPSVISQHPYSQTAQNSQQISPELLMRSVYTVGELIQYAPVKIDSTTFNLLRAIVASEKIDHDTQIVSQFPQVSGGKVVPRSVRAAAVLALGKMSVVDETIAKKTVSVLTRQLRQDSDHCVRNIILITMADICTIGNAAVNMYGDILASCMRDPSILIRKHAVFLVTTLIRDEYFKWKGQVMYFFLGALLDPDASVCEQVHASLLNVLLTKFPNMLINHFVEAMFHLNDVIHPAMAVMVKQEDENCPLVRDDRFTLYGNSRMEDRMKIYKFMMSTFTDVQKLALINKISTESFEAISEESIDVSDRNVVCLLLDSLKIFRSKEMVLKFETGKRAGGVDEIEEEHEEEQKAKAVAADVISFSYMRQLSHEVVPRLFKLREFLKARGDPASINLAKNCHSTILDLFEFYLEHFDALAGNDIQRRGEIANDLRRLRNKNVPNA